MSEAAEGAGMIATGALLAREAERAHAPGHDHADDCTNCGTHLSGPYCHVCGQHGHVHRTAGALVHDILHGVFHFEGKFWSTLPLLAFRPGELTRRYARGERAKFVSPMAIFLFSVFLLFAVVANLPGWSIGDSDFFKGGLEEGVAETRANIAAERLKAEAAIARERRQLADERAEAMPDAGEIADHERDLAAAVKLRDDLVRAQRILPPPDTSGPKAPPSENWFEHKWKVAKANPKLLIYKVKTSAYKYSWALIPFSLPFIWILFPFRRDVGMYDHAIFATYSLSFMSLLIVVLALLGTAGVNVAVLVFAALLIPPFHLYKQLKVAYGLSRLGGLWRTAWMIGFVLFIVPSFAMMLLYLGVGE